MSRPSSAEVRQGLIVSLIAAFLFVVLGVIVFVGPGQQFDTWIAQNVASGRTQLMTGVFSAVTFLGNTDVLTVSAFVLLIAGALYRPLRTEAWCMVGMLALVGLGSDILKHFFMRARPDAALAVMRETSFSFPSGHSMVSLCLFGFLGYVAATRCGGRARIAVAAACAVLIVLIGFSRIYLGVHYTCDVLAGYCAGVPLLTGAILVWRRLSLSPLDAPPAAPPARG